MMIILTDISWAWTVKSPSEARDELEFLQTKLDCCLVIDGESLQVSPGLSFSVMIGLAPWHLSHSFALSISVTISFNLRQNYHPLLHVVVPQLRRLMSPDWFESILRNECAALGMVEMMFRWFKLPMSVRFRASVLFRTILDSWSRFIFIRCWNCR